MSLVTETDPKAATPGQDADEQSSAAEAPPTSGNSDAAIVAAVLSGETQRFGELVRRYTEMIATFAYVRIRDRDLAEEIAQESMVRAYEKLWSLRVPRRFSEWLTGIASNVTLQALDKRRRAAGLTDATLEEAALEGSGDPQPHQAASNTEEWSRLLAEVDTLDTRYKIPVVLKHQEGLSCDEIAERLGMPAGTVRGRLSRAYGMIRKRLATRAKAEGRHQEGS